MGKYSELDKHSGKYTYQNLDCYHYKLSRQEAEEKLRHADIGSFLVRDSSRTPGTYLAISCKDADDKISHELVCVTTSYLNSKGYLRQPNEDFTLVNGLGKYIEEHYNIEKAILHHNGSTLIPLRMSQSTAPSLDNQTSESTLDKRAIAIDVLRLYSGDDSAKNAKLDETGFEANSWKTTPNQYCSPAYDPKIAAAICNRFRALFTSLDIEFSPKDDVADIFVADSSKGGMRAIVDKRFFELLFNNPQKINKLVDLMNSNAGLQINESLKMKLDDEMINPLHIDYIIKERLLKSLETSKLKFTK